MVVMVAIAATAPAIPSQTVAEDENALCNADPIAAADSAIANIATTPASAPAASASSSNAPTICCAL